MTKKQFRFTIQSIEENKALVDWLNQLTSQEKFSETVIEILEFVQKNGLENLKTLEALKKEKLEAEITDLKVKTEERRCRIAKMKGKPLPYGTKSSSETTYIPPEERKIEKIIETKWNNFVDYIKQSRQDGSWSVGCKLCSTGFVSLPSNEGAIERFKKHLEDSHETELLANVSS